MEGLKRCPEFKTTGTESRDSDAAAHTDQEVTGEARLRGLYASEREIEEACDWRPQGKWLDRSNVRRRQLEREVRVDSRTRHPNTWG